MSAARESRAEFEVDCAFFWTDACHRVSHDRVVRVSVAKRYLRRLNIERHYGSVEDNSFAIRHADQRTVMGVALRACSSYRWREKIWSTALHQSLSWREVNPT